jgi:hypothetical protein
MEAVLHNISSQKPALFMNFIPENAIWNRIKPDVEKDLIDYENEIIAELDAKRTIDLEPIEEMLNPWILHPALTTSYRNRLAGSGAVAHPVIQHHQPPRRRRRVHRKSEPILRSGKIIEPEEDSAEEDDSKYEDSEPEVPSQVHCLTYLARTSIEFPETLICSGIKPSIVQYVLNQSTLIQPRWNVLFPMS